MKFELILFALLVFGCGSKNLETNPPKFKNLPVMICIGEQVLNLNNFVANKKPAGIFSGEGVVFLNGIYNFDTSILKNYSTKKINYSYFDSKTQTQKTFFAFVDIVSCHPPYITQVYANEKTERYIEIKNHNPLYPIPENTYFLALYINGGSTLESPTFSISIPTLKPNEVIVIKGKNSLLGNSAAFKIWDTLKYFDANNDILIISKTNDSWAFENRVDLVGDKTNWSFNKSMVRSTTYPNFINRNKFDLIDWTLFSNTEMNETSFTYAETNAELGRHVEGAMIFGFDPKNLPFGCWSDSYNDRIKPDRSRDALVGLDYDSKKYGSFECKNLFVSGVITVFIDKNSSIKIYNDLQIGQYSKLQNNGTIYFMKQNCKFAKDTLIKNLLTKDFIKFNFNCK